MAERLAREWGVEIEGPMPGASCSLVLAAGDFVLRMPLLDEGRETGVAMLRAFSLHGGVAVLREDVASGAVLLPRLRPGAPLDTLPEDAAVDVWIALVRRLRSAQGDALSVESTLRSLWTKPTNPSLVTDIPGLARCLVETSPPPALLHGDLHHDNVLRNGEGWVVIDPEGVSGDPAYEAAAFLRNPVPALGREPDLSGLLRRRILRLAEGMEEPAARLWGWGLVRTAHCVWSDPGAFDGAWLAVAQTLDVMGPEFSGGLS